MTKPLIRIHDLATNEVIDREMTNAEFKIYEENEKSVAADQAKAEAKATAKAAAEGKLAALGLTTNDLRALGLQPVNEALALCSWYTVKRSD